MVEHDVNHHACNGNIKPNGKCPARNGAMPVKPFPQGAAQRDDDHRHDDRSENCVRDKNAEVNRTGPAFSLKMYRSDMCVVIEIANVVIEITN